MGDQTGDNEMNDSPSSATALMRLRMRLESIHYLARDTLQYAFVLDDGAPLPAAEPGAHIGLHLPNGLLRQYSLLQSGVDLRQYRIGVKRDPNSRGGSRFIHEQLRPGVEIDVDAPRNNFPLIEDAAHTVLIGGGIGITPILCMAARLRELGRPMTLIYSCRERVDAALLDELRRACPDLQLHVNAEVGRRIEFEAVVGAAPADSHFYCCGPGAMLAAFEAATAHLPPQRVHVEYFSARQEAALDGGYSVELRRSKQTLHVPAGKTILHVLRDAGIEIAHSCEEGVCGACETRVLEGRPDHRDAILSEPERAANNTMMICCSGCKGERLVLDL